MSPSCRFMRKQPCGNVPISQKEEDLHIERKMFDTLSIKENREQQQKIEPYVDFPNKQSPLQNNHHPSHHGNAQRQTSATMFARTFAPGESNRILHNGYPSNQPQQQQQPRSQQHQQQQYYQQQQQQDPRKISTPNYSDVSRRLETFFTWPKTAYLQPFSLAEAGFVYSGTGDAVKCYKCGVSLRNWEPNDTAWAEHEKWSPLCPLVIQRIQNVNNNNESRAQFIQEASNLSLDETFLRRYQQQQQYARPLYETTRSLPTGLSPQYESRFSPQVRQHSSHLTNNYSHQKPVQNSSNPSTFQKHNTMVEYPLPQAPYYHQQQYPTVQQSQHNNPYSTQRSYDKRTNGKSETNESYVTSHYDHRTPKES